MKKRILLLFALCFMTIGNTFGQTSDDIENLGSFSAPFSTKWGLYPPNYTDISTRYSFTLTRPLDIVVSHCESTLEGGTGIFLLDKDYMVLAANVGDYEHCVDGHAYVVAPCLLPGTYMIEMDWSPNVRGSVYTQLQGLSPNVIRSAKNIGEYNSYFNYIDTKDTSDPYIGYRSDDIYRNSVCYGFYLLCNMDITVSHCGSEMDETSLYLLDENGNDIRSTVGVAVEGACDNLGQAYSKRLNMPPGMYYVVSKGATRNGRITTRIMGTKTVEIPFVTEFAESIGNIGLYDPLFIYENTKDTNNPEVGYQGYDDYRSGVCYRFTLPRVMDAEIFHCGSEVEDTEVYLLDKNGNRLAYNDNYSGTNACDFLSAHLEMPSLAAGTYYVVSKGKSENGKITTHIICKSPETKIGSEDKNYILSRSFRDPYGATWQDKVDYFDEMGRIEETILVKGSAIENDLASLTEYDAFGRVEKQWLQVETWSAAGEGVYVSPEILKQRIRSTNCNDSAPYQLTKYESSPLDRPIREYGAGQDWHSKGKAVETIYQLTNVVGNDSLNCIRYQIKDVTENADTLVAISPAGNYPTGSLHVTRRTDEEGNAVLEFKNRFGQIVLNRQIVRAPYHEFYDTNYIYDEWGNLHVVLPPRASDYIKSGNLWNNASSFILRDYAYLYKYDKRFRITAKRLPGQDWIRYVYDKADYPVFTQDGEQRKRGEWSFSITDGLGRVCLTGVCKNTFELSQSALDTVVNVVCNDYTGLYKGYSLSGTSLIDAEILTVNYYDNYAFMGMNGFLSFANSDYEYTPLSGYGERSEDSAQSLLTGTLTAYRDSANLNILGYIPSVMYYDYRGRMIQSKSGNHLTEGFEKEYIAYDFTSNPLKRKHVHSAAGKGTQTEEYTYTYDHAGRQLLAKHSLNGGNPVILTDKYYDALGRLSDVCRHGNCGRLESWYDYNVRSWITAINGPLFSQKLYYNDKRSNGTNSVCYSGNISGMDWKVTSDNIQRGYDFTYDALSRLKTANYLESNNRKMNCFDTSYRYDKHGNITFLGRYGQTGIDTYEIIDSLYMVYNGNQLEAVEDMATASVYNNGFEFRNGVSSEVEYFYDANGNLTKDLNKNILDIQYNFLNLPRRITFGDGSNISYSYDATGKKLRTVHQAGDTNTTTDYCGNVIYENGIAKTLLVEGGYVSFSDNKYHYYIQDHQGNNRVVADENGNIEEVNHYYPFGGTFASSSSSVQAYKYNGKELDRKNGLDWYDYGARHYNAALGRWHVVDPMAEKYYSLSSYGYCNNNPIRYIDPTGMLYTGYAVDTNGYISKVNNEGGNSYDVLYSKEKYSSNTVKDYDKTGNKTGIQISKGILSGTEMKNMSSKQITGVMQSQEGRATGKTIKSHAYEVKSDNESLSIMNFLDKNTDVEWSNTLMNDNQGNSVNLITTSHENSTIGLGSYQIGKYTRLGFQVIRADHIHPGIGRTTPSKDNADIGNAKNIYKTK